MRLRVPEHNLRFAGSRIFPGTVPRVSGSPEEKPEPVLGALPTSLSVPQRGALSGASGSAVCSQRGSARRSDGRFYAPLVRVSLNLACRPQEIPRGRVAGSQDGPALRPAGTFGERPLIPARDHIPSKAGYECFQRAFSRFSRARIPGILFPVEEIATMSRTAGCRGGRPPLRRRCHGIGRLSPHTAEAAHNGNLFGTAQASGAEPNLQRLDGARCFASVLFLCGRHLTSCAESPFSARPLPCWAMKSRGESMSACSAAGCCPAGQNDPSAGPRVRAAGLQIPVFRAGDGCDQAPPMS